ncbi:hypothetical protein [Candidatus Protofrankia californiensis]|nr:hypothetical protein [Candidatus Protofrankia californiensis]
MGPDGELVITSDQFVGDLRDADDPDLEGVRYVHMLVGRLRMRW